MIDKYYKGRDYFHTRNCMCTSKKNVPYFLLPVLLPNNLVWAQTAMYSSGNTAHEAGNMGFFCS